MSGREARRRLRSLHRVVGVALSGVIVVAGISGFLLQHPEWLGEADLAAPVLAASTRDAGVLWRGAAWGLEESRDGGASWREVPMLAPPQEVRRIVHVPGPPDTLYVLGREELVRSLDGGLLWEPVPLPQAGDGGFRDLAVGPGARLLLADELRLWRRAGSDPRWEPMPGDRERRTLHRWIHDVHTGRILARPGRLLTELGALALVVLTLTGMVMARRRARRKAA